MYIIWYYALTASYAYVQAVLVGDDLRDCRYILGISLFVDLTDIDALVIIYILAMDTIANW